MSVDTSANQGPGLLVTVIGGSVTTQQSSSLSPGAATQTQAPYYSVNNLNGSSDGNAIDTSAVAMGQLSFTVNSGLSTNTFTGSVNLQSSNDGQNWYDYVIAGISQRVAVATGPGALVFTGSIGGPMLSPKHRIDVAFTAGSSCSLTSSFSAKG